MQDRAQGYDSIADWYAEMARTEQASPNRRLRLIWDAYLDLIGDVAGVRVCDVACGEGSLARRLAVHGANVVAVDISQRLLDAARASDSDGHVTYVNDDAQTLVSIPDQAFDLVTCRMALMDIPDLGAALRSAHRILLPGGRYVVQLTHPCFEGPRPPGQNETMELDPSGRFLARRQFEYAQEGFWRSTGTGVRGRVGSHHRRLSTYVNALSAAGFVIEQMAEPTLPLGEYEEPGDQCARQIPGYLLVAAAKAHR